MDEFMTVTSDRPTPQEIVVVHRNESASVEQPPRPLDSIEQLSKIVSLVAIPVILALVGWAIQDSLTKRSVSQEYVALAVSILKESKEETEPSLREWAVELLNQNSPTKFSESVADQLIAGDVRLPSINALLTNLGGGAAAISPDGRLVATGHDDGSARIWDYTTGQEILRFPGHQRPVTSVAFSPDGASLATGSLDSTARVFSVADGKERLTIRGHENGVIGVSFTPDGQHLLTRSLDGTIRTWDIATGRELTVVRVRD